MDPANGVGIPLAMAAGFVSFLSPCVLPIVPGYIAAVSGVTPDQARDAGWRRVLWPSFLFVLSFSAVFIVLGLGATTIGRGLSDHRETLEKVSAGLMIAMGLFFIAAPFVTRLGREFHVGGLIARAGRGGPVIAGFAFAVAWTPCIGPTLGAILSAAALTNSVERGALLLAFYSAGLAIPFLLTSLAFGRATTSFGFVKRHYGVVIGIGGVILIGMGLLIWTGEFTRLNVEAQNALDGLGLDFWNSV